MRTRHSAIQWWLALILMGTLARPGRGAETAFDPMDRGAVVDLFNRVYLAGDLKTLDWTGSAATCDAGDISAAAREAMRQRINYFRTMAGLPGEIVFQAEWDAGCQAAALMMSAQGALSHAPGSDWACFTAAGADAAKKSNLSLGETGLKSIDLMIDDPGMGNGAVGHRRWLLYPPQKTMGAGAVSAGGSRLSAAAVRVVDGAGARPESPEFVAWPPVGFVPFDVLPRQSQRWSFSQAGADFSQTVISVEVAGQSVAVTRESETKGYGDNTLVWVMEGLPTQPPADDMAFVVRLEGVKVGGKLRDVEYTVTLITAEPELAIRDLGDGQLELSWRAGVASFELESAPAGPAEPAWQPETGMTLVTGNRAAVKIDTDDETRLFRLRRKGT